MWGEQIFSKWDGPTFFFFFFGNEGKCKVTDIWDTEDIWDVSANKR